MPNLYGSYQPSLGGGREELFNQYATPQTPQNANYYSEGGDVLNQGGDAAMTSGNPYIAGGGLAAKAIGTGLDIYGKYKDRQEAQRQYDEQLKRYESKEAERLEDKARNQRMRDRQEGYFASDFSQGLQDRFANVYGNYGGR